MTMQQPTSGARCDRDFRRLAVGTGVVGLGVAVLLTGCSVGVRDAGQAAGTSSASPAATSTAPADGTGTGAGTETTGSTTAPQGACFVGRHAVRTITGRESFDTPLGAATASGSGGSLLLELDGAGQWELSSDGSKPVSFRIAGITATVRIDGRAAGGYARVGSQHAFRLDGSSGSAVIHTPAGSERVSMDDVATALAPSGTATISCRSGQVRLVSESVEMTLTPVGGSTGAAGGRPGGPPGGGRTGSAPEAPTTITQAGLNGTYDCGNHPVTVTGAGNRLHLVGRCPKLTVTGAFNEITVDMAGSIAVTGARAKVIWHGGLNGKRPAVNVTGVGSTATQG